MVENLRGKREVGEKNMNSQEGRVMEFKSWESQETPEMRNALKELWRISPVSGTVMQNYIGSGDYEEFELRGEPALEVRLGGTIPAKIKKLIPVIIGKQRIFPERIYGSGNKRRTGVRKGYFILTKSQIADLKAHGTSKEVSGILHVAHQKIIDIFGGKQKTVPGQTYTKITEYLNPTAGGKS
jgi:hypothetical protein